MMTTLNTITVDDENKWIISKVIFDDLILVLPALPKPLLMEIISNADFITSGGNVIVRPKPNI